MFVLEGGDMSSEVRAVMAEYRGDQDVEEEEADDDDYDDDDDEAERGGELVKV